MNTLIPNMIGQYPIFKLQEIKNSYNRIKFHNVKDANLDKHLFIYSLWSKFIFDQIL